jgi:hypothetical protein
MTGSRSGRSIVADGSGVGPDGIAASPGSVQVTAPGSPGGQPGL